MADIRIVPGSSIMSFTSSLNFTEKITQDSSGSLNLYGSGSTGRTELFSIDGNNGRLFTVSDDLSDSLFSVNTIAGLPVIEAFANNTVVMGQYGTNALVVSGSNVGIGTTTPSEKLDVNGYVKATGFKTPSGTATQFLMADGSTNSNTYVKTDGTNATGTWGINISGNASKLNPLSGDSNYKLAYTADGARTNAGEWGRAVMYYVPNGQTYGIRVDRADYADNAGTVGGYAASSLWRSDGGTWNPSANITLNQSANSQEWSFDIYRNGYTGGYWQVWDSANNTMLKVDATSGKVYAPYNFVGNLEGNAATATKLQTARTIGGVSFDGTANIDLPGVNAAGNQSTTGNAATATTLQTARTLTIGATGKNFNGSANVAWTLAEIGAANANQLTAGVTQTNFDTIKPPGLYQYDGTMTSTPNNRANYRSIEIGSSGRYSQIALSWDIDGMWFRKQQDSTWGTWREVLHSGNYNSFVPTLTGGNASGTWGINISGTAGSVAWTNVSGRPSTIAGLLGEDSIDANPNTRLGSGYYQQSSTSTANGWPVNGGWYHLHSVAHSNTGNYYAMQFAADFYQNLLYYRSTNNSGTTAWSQVALWNTNVTFGTVNATGGLSANSDMRAPIFYDSNNTGYYVDPASNSNLNTGTFNGRLKFSDYIVSNNAGGMMGDYSINGTTSKVIWTIGESWPLANMYGLGYEYGSGYGHHLVLKNNGTTYSRFGFAGGASIGGSVIAEGDFRAPIFYDSNDTGYYIDPASTSNLYRLTVNQTITGNISGNAGTATSATSATFSNYLSPNYIGGQQLNPQTYFNYNIGVKVAMTAAAGVWSDTLWINGYAGGDVLSMCALHFQRNGTPRMYISTQNSTATSYGTLYEVLSNYGGTGTYSTTGDFRAPIFYDSNNTGYYIDPAGFSQLSSIYTNNWVRVQGDTGVYSQDYGGHLRRTVNASHGTWEIYGYNKGGYAGLNIYDSSGYINNYMHENGNGGLYLENQSGKWAYYWHRGNACLGIGDSTTSSSYKMYVAGGIYATGDVVAYSDRRKKTNITTIDNALEKVKNLRGVYYDKIDELDKGRRTGVIAQEVQEVLPEAVTYAEDVDEYGVLYGNIVGVLIEAIKEQQKQIDELKELIKNK